MTAVAFIPARGGSTRIPRKNLAVIGGSTLVVRAIWSAWAASCDRVVVSTDDDEIARLAKRYRCETERTFPHSATTQIEEAIAHWLPADLPDDTVIALLQPTSPYRRPETVRQCIALAREHGCSVSVAPTPDAYFAGMLTDGEFSPRHSVQTRPRSQDLADWHTPDGSCWAFTARHFRATGNRTSRRARGVVTGWPECWQIDTPEDLEIARLLGPMEER